MWPHVQRCRFEHLTEYTWHFAPTRVCQWVSVVIHYSSAILSALLRHYASWVIIITRFTDKERSIMRIFDRIIRLVYLSAKQVYHGQARTFKCTRCYNNNYITLLIKLLRLLICIYWHTHQEKIELIILLYMPDCASSVTNLHICYLKPIKSCNNIVSLKEEMLLIEEREI